MRTSILPGVLLTLVLVSGSLIIGTADCRPGATPGSVIEAGAPAVLGDCSWIEGITDNATVVAICASLPELALVAEIAASLIPLASAGRQASASSACAVVPGLKVCATREQMGRGIVAVLARRGVRLGPDAGLSDAGR